MGDDRPPRYIEVAEDGAETVVYRASGLGGCERAFVAHARGVTPADKPEWFQEVLDEGTAFEDPIRQMYQSETDLPVHDDQQEVELELGTMHGRRVIVRGHTDGTGTSPTGEVRLFEAKKFRDSTWSKFLRDGVECNVNYPWQVSVYMHALGLDECDFVGGRIIDGALSEIHVKHLADPPLSLKAIRQRVRRIERLIDVGLDPTEVDCPTPAQYPCPFFKLHDEKDEDDAFDFPDEEDIRELISALGLMSSEVNMYREKLRTAEKLKSQAAEALRDWIGERGQDDTKKFRGFGYEITRTRKTIAEHVRKASTQDYFTLKVQKESK